MVEGESVVKTQDKINWEPYIAKTPTQQPEFLESYPSFDGRGVVIAIIDSCIDVSLPGLQKTSTGDPKIIDCFDLTGNGNVDTSKIKKLDKNNILIGLTGRKLKIPSKWINPSGNWHLGIKSIYELFDEEALSKITKLRKEKIKAENQKLKSTINEFNIESNDYKDMIKYFDETENLSKDSMVTDCIVWNDGREWQACIDTSFIGDLENVKVMTNFRDCHEYGTFVDGHIVYCLNIRENGNLLEIYVPYGDHGTLIANIAAAFYPNEPEQCGLAPGAQIISFAVLDLIKSHCMNIYAVEKAFQKCIEMNVDVINYSGGGLEDHEYDLIKEMVEKHGIIILSTAGNNGPVHSSVYETEQFQDWILNIGACFTSDMTKFLHETDSDFSPIVSYFSSQGPMPNSGACGITLVAPGKGVVHGPRHFPETYQFFEATSFCCPNAVGAISCLISGLKAKSIPVTFFKLKLALINTAFLPKGGNKLAFGNGIIQIKDAYQFYQNNLNTFPNQITNISTTLIKEKRLFKYLWKNNYQSGIILKVVDTKINTYNYNVKIDISDTFIGNRVKLEWILKLSQNADIFIKDFKIADNTFSVKIDISDLKNNSINYGEISGFDISNPFWGPLFHFPITVIIPKFFYETEKINEIIELSSKLPYRLFIPPCSSEICGFFIRINCLEIDQTVEMPLQVQIFAKSETSCEDTKLDFTGDNDTQTCKFSIDEKNEIYEICIIYDDVKDFKNLKFKFELLFIGKPSLFLKILSFFVKNEEKSDNEMMSNDQINSNKSLDKAISNMIIEKMLFAHKINLIYLNGRMFLVTYYYFTIYDETYCEFGINPYTYDTRIDPLTIQIFTLSKKFIAGYINGFFDKGITLAPGTYIIKGLFECQDFEVLEKNFPTCYLLPLFTIEVDSNTVIKCRTYNIWDLCRKYVNVLKANISNYFYSFSAKLKELFNYVNPKDAQKWHNIIRKYYSEQNYSNVKNETNLFLQKINAKQFLNNFKNIENNGNFWEKELLETRKSLILDALFFKADSILNEYLKNCQNIPPIFKNNFGFDIIFCDSESITKHLNPSMFDILWSIVTYDIFPKQPKLQYSNNKLINENATNLPQNYSKIIDRKNVKKITSLFLKFAEDSDFRKSLILIKKALIFGNFGTALFHLNKISTQNQTIPNFKIFDEAIFQLLKQLGWNHLIEAHENASLDRHRNYYRMF